MMWDTSTRLPAIRSAGSRGTSGMNLGQGSREGSMRKRIYNWQGQRFAYIWLEGEPGQSLEKQSQGLFDRAGPELASLELALDKNVVRTRVDGPSPVRHALPPRASSHRTISIGTPTWHWSSGRWWRQPRACRAKLPRWSRSRLSSGISSGVRWSFTRA